MNCNFPPGDQGNPNINNNKTKIYRHLLSVILKIFNNVLEISKMLSKILEKYSSYFEANHEKNPSILINRKTDLQKKK